MLCALCFAIGAEKERKIVMFLFCRGEIVLHLNISVGDDEKKMKKKTDSGNCLDKQIINKQRQRLRHRISSMEFSLVI